MTRYYTELQGRPMAVAGADVEGDLADILKTVPEFKLLASKPRYTAYHAKYPDGTEVAVSIGAGGGDIFLVGLGEREKVDTRLDQFLEATGIRELGVEEFRERVDSAIDQSNPLYRILREFHDFIGRD